MKFAFSTLGCPGWTVEHVANQAVRMGYDGVELRLLENEVIDPVHDEAKLREAVSIYRTRGLDVCAFDTSCKFNLPDGKERASNIASLRTWITLAQELQVPILRVFGGAGNDNNREQENQWVADSLRQVAEQAEQAGVIVALETHDGFASAKRTASVLEAVNSPAIAALWDSHHPYRMGESAEEVWQILGKHVAHVHVKDAIRDTTDPYGWKLVLIGQGEVPVREQLQSLAEHGYNGYISVEWEKRWHPEIEEPEVALPQHIAWLRDLENVRSQH